MQTNLIREQLTGRSNARPASFWLKRGLILLAVAATLLPASVFGAPVRVLIWDEQQPAQKPAYTNFIGNAIAAHLRDKSGLFVSTARLDDLQQGISVAALSTCDVLVWWGHARQAEISAASGRDIVNRIKAGQLSLIALHSAHWSVPFMEAMNERAREDALRPLLPTERSSAKITETNLFANLRTAPKADDRLSPSVVYRKPFDGPVEVKLTLPNCCFPAYRADGKPSRMRVLMPEHPIARGIPKEFIIGQTEMYNEPFHVPAPDAVIFDEHWEQGEWFRSGALWNLGRGKVFYFRPGHETYPVFKNEQVLLILENAIRWLGEQKYLRR